MAIRYPKNYNRNMAIRQIGKEEDPWLLIAEGISSRGSNFSESTETYYYFSGRGTAEKEPTTQEVGYTYTGNRARGDAAQDYILDTILYDLDSRQIEFLDWDDSIDVSGLDAPANGWKGQGAITINDPGSGDAQSRQNISFTIDFRGKPERGTVKKDSGGTGYTWTPKGAGGSYGI